MNLEIQYLAVPTYTVDASISKTTERVALYCSQDEDPLFTPWKTDIQEATFLNTIIHRLKWGEGHFIAAFVVNSIWNRVFTLPHSSLILSSMGLGLTYDIFKNREYLYNLYNHFININNTIFTFQKNMAFIELVENKIQKELLKEIGMIWLEKKSFTVEEGIEHFTKICLTDFGICNGSAFNFLKCMYQLGGATLNDTELECKLNPLNSIKYQVMCEIKIGVKNHYIKLNSSSLDDLLIIDQCNFYDPYSILGKYQIYHRSAGQGAIDRVFGEIWKIAHKDVKNPDKVLVGKIKYVGESKVGHVISAQFNFDHSRYLDVSIYSFKNLEDLFKALYCLSNDYFKTYNEIEITLWEFPYKH